MSEKTTLFSSKIKYSGVFSFNEFYKFCYEWLKEEGGLDISEEKYVEKLKGDSKDIEVAWKGTKKITDYFKVEMGISFRVLGLKKVEMTKGGAKIETNKGSINVGIKSTLIRDYDGKFEKDAIRKFLRGIYEKWVIAARIEEMEGKLIGDSDEFLGQAKAYLDLEGKR